MKLTHIRILVRDYPACFVFYKDVMGLPVHWGDETTGYASYKTGTDTILSIFGRTDMARAIGKEGLPVDAVCQDKAMLILEVDDLEKTFDDLTGKGTSFVAEIQEHPEWGIRSTYLRDPDGTLIELYVPLPKEAWSEELRRKDEETGNGG